jgi:hypothetical protein
MKGTYHVGIADDESMKMDILKKGVSTNRTPPSLLFGIAETITPL